MRCERRSLLPSFFSFFFSPFLPHSLPQTLSLAFNGEWIFEVRVGGSHTHKVFLGICSHFPSSILPPLSASTHLKSLIYSRMPVFFENKIWKVFPKDYMGKNLGFSLKSRELGARGKNLYKSNEVLSDSIAN